MFKKRHAVLVLLSLIICMVAISSASATENINDDLAIEDADINEISNDDVLNSENNDIVASDNEAKDTVSDILASDDDIDDTVHANSGDDKISQADSKEVFESVSSDLSDEEITNQIPVASKEKSDALSSDGSKHDVKITIKQVKSNKANVNTVSIKMVDDDTGDAVQTGDAKLKVSGKTYSVKTDSEGVAKINLKNLKNGKYKATLTFSGNSYLNAASETSFIQVSNYKSSTISKGKITIKQSGKYYQDKKISVKLVDASTGSAVKKQKVKLKFSNGKNVNVKTNGKGVAVYKINFMPGKYSVKAYVSNDNIKFSAKKLSNIKISKIPLKINFKNVKTTFASGKKYAIKVINKATKKPVKGIKVKIKIKGGKTISKTTGAKGKVVISPSKLSIGAHKVVIKVGSNKAHSAASKSNKITINKASLKVSAPSVTNIYKKAQKFTVKVKNKASGKPIKGIKVTMKVYTGKKYKTVTVKTDKKGVAAFSTKSLSKGKHKVVINVKGNSKFKKASKTSSVKISTKIATEITLGNDEAWIYTNRIYVTSYTYSDLRTLMLDFTPTLKGKDGHEIKESYSGKLEYFSSSGYNFASDTVEGTYGEYKHHIGQNVPFYGGHYVLTLKYDGNSRYSGTTFTKTYYLY